MNQLIKVELRKLRTTPAAWITIGVTVALTLTSVVTTILLAGKSGTPPAGSVANVNKVLQTGAVTSMSMLVLGILVMAGEYRHRTVVSAYLAEPRRGRVLVAKLVTVGVLGILVGAGIFGLGLAVALPVFAAKGVHHLPVPLASMWLGAVLATAVYGLLGVALGAVARSTVGAVIGALLWVQAVEVGLLQGVVPSLAKWLPAGAGVAVTAAKGSAPHLLTPVVAAVVLVGWAVALSGLAARFSLSRDVR